MPESQGEPDRKVQEIDLELEEAMRRAACSASVRAISSRMRCSLPPCVKFGRGFEANKVCAGRRETSLAVKYEPMAERSDIQPESDVFGEYDLTWCRLKIKMRPGFLVTNGSVRRTRRVSSLS